MLIGKVKSQKLKGKSKEECGIVELEFGVKF